MELGDIDIFDLDGYQQRGIPHDQFEYLREHAPVFFHPEPQQELRPDIPPTGFWCITKHEDVVCVSRDPQTFSSQRGGTNIFDVSPAELARITLMLINMDPPKHVRLRRLIKTGFSPRMVRNMTPQVRRAVRETIDDVIESGECDFVENIAAEISLKILCDLLGVRREDRRQVYDWTNWLMFFDDPDSPSSAEEMLRISHDIWAYASALAREKREHPGHDITSVLQAAEVDGQRLSELEYNMFFLMLLVAGNETTRTGISQGLRLLLEHPDQWERLKSDPDRYLATAVDEILRFEPPVISFRRTATCDTELRGQKIREGDKVVMWYSAANRDPDVFENPLSFDITREHNPHLSFGMGEHFCLGSHVARLEMVETFREIIRRMPDVEAVAPPERFRSNFLNGFKHYYIRFTPGERLGWTGDDTAEAAA